MPSKTALKDRNGLFAGKKLAKCIGDEDGLK